MLRQIVDHVAGKRCSLFIETVRFGQSGGVHIHDTLQNALSGAVECKRSGGVVGEAQSRELPEVVGVKEVAIGNTAVTVRSCKRGAAQHQLIDHELAVVLSERALDGAV